MATVPYRHPGYDPPDFFDHLQAHRDRGEEPRNIAVEGDHMTECSICDPMIEGQRMRAQVEREEAKVRKLMAIAWDEGRRSAEQDTLRHTRLNDWGDASAWDTPNPYREQ